MFVDDNLPLRKEVSKMADQYAEDVGRWSLGGWLRRESPLRGQLQLNRQACTRVGDERSQESVFFSPPTIEDVSLARTRFQGAPVVFLLRVRAHDHTARVQTKTFA